MTHLVFVYGTLKRGHWNNQLLEDQVLVGESVTAGTFAMYDGGFPILTDKLDLPHDMKAQVLGELYEIDDKCLARCDQLEGHPTFYERHKLPVLLLNKHYGPLPMEAWVYIGRSACDHGEELIEPRMILETYKQIEWRDQVKDWSDKYLKKGN